MNLFNTKKGNFIKDAIMGDWGGCDKVEVVKEMGSELS